MCIFFLCGGGGMMEAQGQPSTCACIYAVHYARLSSPLPNATGPPLKTHVSADVQQLCAGNLC